MNSTNKKAYVYKMRLVPANVVSIIIFIILAVVTYCLKIDFSISGNFGLLVIILILYLFLHEFLHGIGYMIGGTKKENISYGICLEKGILYCMSYQEISKKNILISLQMPFITIGVITYIIGWLCNIPYLVFLSIINLTGASMDLVMFKYISSIKDVTYSESGEPDEFVLISKEDLKKKKSMFLEIKEVKNYNKEDYKFKNIKKINISKFSYIILSVILIVTILSII